MYIKLVHRTARRFKGANMGEEKNPPTVGQVAVGLNFNPSQDPQVKRLKELYAEVIDILDADRGSNRDERARLASIAITEAQTAQMWAVKAVTFTR